MIRTNLIAAVSALAIGFAGVTTAPAQADDNTAEILAGVAVFAIVGTIIANSHDDHHHGRVVSRGHSPRYYGHSDHGYYRHSEHKYYGHEAQKRRLYRTHHRKSRLRYKHRLGYGGHGHKRHYRTHDRNHHKKHYKY